MKGGVRSCEPPNTFGGCDGWFALEFVELLFDGTPITCLGWVCVDSDAEGGVIGASVLSNDGSESAARPTFPRHFLESGRCNELESDSRLELDIRSTELFRGACW